MAVVVLIMCTGVRGDNLCQRVAATLPNACTATTLFVCRLGARDPGADSLTRAPLPLQRVPHAGIPDQRSGCG